MQYKIIVDKQPSTNPSNERKEYVIDIEELRYKDGVYDSLIITKNEDYVMRRLNLSEYHVLSVLDEPVKEPIENVNIELFEGDNYIYISDMSGNKFYAEYLVKNDFTDLYVTKNQMTSAINQTAGAIEFNVNQKLEGYSTTEEMNSVIQMRVKEIDAKVEKKIDGKTITGAYLILRINEDTSESKLNADKIELSANDILNLLAGNTIDMSAKNLVISSDSFNVDKDGKVTLKCSGTVVFKVENKDNSKKRVYITDQFVVIVDGSGNEKASMGIDGNNESVIDIDYIYMQGSRSVVVGSSSGNNYIGTGSGYSGITTNVRGNTVRLYSHSSGAIYLGYSGSTAVTSDENLKDIYELDNKYIEFFKNLKPVSYIYKDRGHRNHIGFGARQVEEALTKAGLTTEQFAGVLKDTDVTIAADEMGTEEDVHFDELYSLRYEEFIALNTMMIQKQQAIIEQNNFEIEELKSKMLRLEEKINEIM